jgi:hypothetical protein
MKARAFFIRALLFAIVLAPSALRASARPLAAPLCSVPSPHLRAGSVGVKFVSAPDQCLASTPGHHGPAPRLHRIRGKKISVQRGFASAPRCYASTGFLLSAASLVQQDMGGPNPSRGPPSQFSL